MNGPNAHSGKKRVRDFEKSVLADVYADLCEPGDHHQDCPERSQVCPVAREEQRGNR